MDAIESSPAVRQPSAWSRRVRLAASVGLLWAALHLIAEATVLPRGLDRPLVVLIGDGGIAAAIVTLVLLLGGALLGTLLSGRRDHTQGLLVVGFALALWAWPRGTIDDWLKMKNPVPGPPTAAAYWPLLAEYAYWAVAVAAIIALGNWAGRSAGSAASRVGWRQALGFDPAQTGLREGIIALAVTVAVAAVLMLVLTGPRLGHTYRGQVYFAVAVSFIVGVLVARRLSSAGGLIWSLPAPLAVGILGVFLAASKPGLPAGYEQINVIPAWGLVRPLPVEMIGVGLVATVMTHRAATRLSSEDDRG